MSNQWLSRPARAVRTPFPALVAAVRADQGASATARLALAPRETHEPSSCLAVVVLARPGWNDAVRKLEGRFDAPCRAPEAPVTPDAPVTPEASVTNVTGAFTTRLEPSFSPPSTCSASPAAGWPRG